MRTVSLKTQLYEVSKTTRLLCMSIVCTGIIAAYTYIQIFADISYLILWGKGVGARWKGFLKSVSLASTSGKLNGNTSFSEDVSNPNPEAGP